MSTERWDMAAGSTPTDEWLDTLIRSALQSSFGRAEPPSVVWGKIRQHVLQTQWSARQGKTHHSPKPVGQDRERCDVFGWSAVLAGQERYEDLRREADSCRLVRQAMAGRQRGRRFYFGAMNWLGRRLVAWGWGLQERYGAAATPPALEAANYAR